MNYTDPEWARSALVTIDVQRDVLDGQPLQIAGSSTSLPNIARLVAAYRSRALPIVHIVRLYLQDGSNVDLCRRQEVEQGASWLIAGSDGSEIASDLLPHPEARLEPDLLLSGGIQNWSDQEVVMYKPRWGAFYQTTLESHLNRNDVTTVVFGGFNHPNCPRTSIYQASERDFRVVVAQDAVSGLDECGRAELENIGVSVLTTKEVVRTIEGVRALEHSGG